MAPPLYRDRPNWYQKGLAQVAARFSNMMSARMPANLFLLPSFVCQDLSPDGIHLSVVSGLHYIIHLFDESTAILALEPREPELKLVKVQESVRMHDDRLSYLEGRHGALQGRVDIKFAVDSEFKDWMTNRSEEDWMTIMGLPRLGQMLPREWQSAARKQVTSFLKDVLSASRVRQEFSVLYVGNPIRHRPNGGTVYNVRLNSIGASARIRELYSGFFSRRNPNRLPHDFRGISVRNKVTLATRVRIRILQQFAKNYLASNPGGTATVKGYDPRPMLVTAPPKGSTTSHQRSYNFIEACTMLPAIFSEDGLASIFQAVGTHFSNELRSTFIVLDDDDRARCEDLAKNSQGARSRPAPSSGGSVHFSGTVSGAGTGMEVQSDMLRLLRSPPPPPPPRTSSLAPRSRATQSRSQSPEDRADPKSQRGLKRARQEAAHDDRDKKRFKSSRRTPTPSSSSESEPPPPRRKKKARKQKKKSSKSKRKSRRRHSSSSSTSSSSSSASSSSASSQKTVFRER